MAKKAQLFSPLEKSPTAYPIAAFDIEGEGGPGKFISGAVLTENEFADFTSPLKLLSYLRTRRFSGYRIFAHNLAYDYGILEPYINRKDYPTLIDGRPFKVKLSDPNKHPRYLADSLLFAAGLPLSKLGKAINLPKLETPPSLTGNYDSTKEWYCEPHNKLWCIDCYLKRDTEIVFKYIDLFQNTINELGGEVRFTLASTAMDLFRRAYLDDEFLTPFEKRNEFARNAYYGGRVEPFRLGRWDNVNVFDINSLYPYVMYTRQYPHPNHLKGPTSNTTLKTILKYEGVSDVTIHIPKTFAPILPYRHNGKLFFPYGTLRGHWTHIEIREAIKRGAVVKTVHYSLYSTQTVNPFKKYVHNLYHLRQQLKLAGDPRELVIKIMLNSLYGKFGQRNDTGLQKILPFSWWLENGKPVGTEFRVIGDYVSVLQTIHVPGQPSYINTLWASYITAYARLALYGYIEQAGEETIYCDTDSIFIQGNIFTGFELGQMKMENKSVDLEIIGPKAYLLYENNNIVKAKCKGVPQDHKVDFLMKGYASFSRPTGLLEAGRLKPKSDGTPYYPSEWREVHKQRQNTSPKRRTITTDLTGSGSFLTVPFAVEELPQ